MTAVRRRFTLLEMIAVAAILALGTAVSVGVLRKRSGGAEFERRCVSFSDFCGKVRRQAMESGRPRSLYCNAAERCFESGAVPEAAGSEIAPLVPPPELDPAAAQAEERAPELRTERWVVPEEFSVPVVTADGFGERLEVFRFYPDGGVFQTAELVFEYGSMRRSFRIQPLTGKLLCGELP